MYFSNVQEKYFDASKLRKSFYYGTLYSIKLPTKYPVKSKIVEYREIP